MNPPACCSQWTPWVLKTRPVLIVLHCTVSYPFMRTFGWSVVSCYELWLLPTSAKEWFKCRLCSNFSASNAESRHNAHNRALLTRWIFESLKINTDTQITGRATTCRRSSHYSTLPSTAHKNISFFCLATVLWRHKTGAYKFNSVNYLSQYPLANILYHYLQ